MKIQTTMIERITLTGPYEESGLAFAYCAENEYHVTRSGPKRLSAMDVDSSQFVIIAEHIISTSVATSGARAENSADPPQPNAESER